MKFDDSGLFPYDSDHVVEGKLNSEVTDLKRRVVNFLATKNRPGLRQLEVEVKGDVVVLSGCVRSFYEKQLASHLCERVAGVLRVVDRIDVTEVLDAADESTDALVGYAGAIEDDSRIHQAAKERQAFPLRLFVLSDRSRRKE